MQGIYKIVNPKGRVYIGQSMNIEHRWAHYKNLQCKDQVKLLRSLVKYGPENHKFEILEQCTNLNERERYYQELYNAVEKGLNLRYVKAGDKSGSLSIETRNRMSESKKGSKNTMFGKSHSESTKRKIRQKALGRKPSTELRELWSQQRKGVPKSDEHRKKTSDAMSNNPNNVFNHTVKCTYCGKEGQKPNMNRWHFNNCKEK